MCPVFSGQVKITTIDLSSPITGVQEGDYYGYRMEVVSAGGNQFYARTGQSNVTSYYVTDADPTDDDYNWTGQSSIAGAVVPIEMHMQAPQMVFIGDSIMMGATAHTSFLVSTPEEAIETTIEYQLTALTGYTYQNMGIGSQTTSNVVNRFTADIVDLKPRAVVMEGGVNDIAGGSISKATFLSNWTTMLDAANTNNIVPIVLLILPWSNGNTSQMTTLDDWNASLRSLAETYTNAVVVDASSYVGEFRSGGAAGNLWDIQAAYNADGVHFNQAGHTQIAQAIADALKPTVTFDSDFSTWESGNVTVNYNLIQSGDVDTLNISQTATSGVEYSTDGTTWSDATDAGGSSEGLTGLSSASSTGANHIFVWDSTADLAATEDSSVYLRIRANNRHYWK